MAAYVGTLWSNLGSFGYTSCVAVIVSVMAMLLCGWRQGGGVTMRPCWSGFLCWRGPWLRDGRPSGSTTLWLLFLLQSFCNVCFFRVDSFFILISFVGLSGSLLVPRFDIALSLYFILTSIADFRQVTHYLCKLNPCGPHSMCVTSSIG